MHEQDVLYFFAQYGHIYVCVLLCLVYIINIVDRYLYIDIIKLSVDLGQALVAHTREGRPSFLCIVRARTGMCSSSSCIYNKQCLISISIYIKLSLDPGQALTTPAQAADYSFLPSTGTYRYVLFFARVFLFC